MPPVVTRSRPVRPDEPFWTSREQLDEIQSFTTASGSWPGFSVGRFRSARATGMSSGNSPTSMFMVILLLRDIPSHDGWRNGRWYAAGAKPAGNMFIHDLSEQWISNISYSMECFHAYIPYTAFHSVTAELRLPEIQSLTTQFESCRDETMINLTKLLLPVLARPSEAVALFVDHVFAAITTHLITKYGHTNINVFNKLPRWRMTSVQLNRITNMLLDDITADISLDQLAMLVGFSRSHFIRAFRQSTGLPPYRWLLHERVKRAQIFLSTTNLPVAEIALNCGFSDQAHMTRIFTNVAGISPGAWRRQRRD